MRGLNNAEVITDISILHPYVLYLYLNRGKPRCVSRAVVREIPLGGSCFRRCRAMKDRSAGAMWVCYMLFQTRFRSHAYDFETF